MPTCDPLNNLIPCASLRRILQLEFNLAEIPEIRPTLDDQNVSLVSLCTQCRRCDIEAFPSINSLGNKVQMIMASKQEVNTVNICDRSLALVRRAKREHILC
ncbi:hypothetical protein CC2G_005854 [Coprinopsis cinerea AmutBmut pab1-1]|nr:hypothetical protein CC2G_005854 [Coprinopsis cinerea AmutBmut pab1-1]